MFKVILYHPGQYAILKDETYKVCESTYGLFEILSYREDFPFRDEASISFLKRRNVHFLSDSDRYTVCSGGVDNFFPITTLNRCEQEGLILIHNSQKGVYTHATHLDDLVINALKKLDIDILLAVCVDEDYVYGILSTVKDFEPVNFSFRGSLLDFCLKFEYDWKRDLPDIAKCIGYKYDKYVPLTYYSQWFEAGIICNKKILVSAALYDREFFSRRLAVMLIDFMKDDSVKLSKVNSIKNPDLRLILDELPSVADDVKRTFYLIIDIDETIRSERDIVDYCIYGGWINKEFVEVLGKEEVLPIFEDLIPDILRREMILCG
jgi:hypothetical protein